MTSTNVSTAPGRVAIIGTGSRSMMFINGIIDRPDARIVAFCEPNRVRAEFYNKHLEKRGQVRVPVYKPEQFGELLDAEKVDTVVITCIDALHDLYIVLSLRKGGTHRFAGSVFGVFDPMLPIVRVVTEKPMTTDVEKCRKINQAVRETGGSLTVTFNYRYNPVHEAVKRLIASGEIGNGTNLFLSINCSYHTSLSHSPLCALRMALRYRARCRLLPPLAPTQIQFRWTHGAQVRPPL